MLKRWLLFTLALLTGLAGRAQVAPAVKGDHSPEIRIGGTLSDFTPDYTLARLYGFGAYLDVVPLRTNHFNLGIEGELEALNIHQVVHVHEKILAIGPELSYHSIKGFKPFGSLKYGLGTFYNPYFTAVRPSFYHDTYGIWVLAGGTDYRVNRRVDLRLAYEYQDWTHFRQAKTLNPNGVIFGVSYRLH